MKLNRHKKWMIASSAFLGISGLVAACSPMSPSVSKVSLMSASDASKVKATNATPPAPRIGVANMATSTTPVDAQIISTQDFNINWDVMSASQSAEDVSTSGVDQFKSTGQTKVDGSQAPSRVYLFVTDLDDATISSLQSTVKVVAAKVDDSTYNLILKEPVVAQITGDPALDTAPQNALLQHVGKLVVQFPSAVSSLQGSSLYDSR